MFELRRKRFYSWLTNCSNRKLNLASSSSPKIIDDIDNQLVDFKWFAMNCRSILYRHRDFEYITYTRYFTLQQPIIQLPSATTSSFSNVASSSSSPASYINQQ